MTIDLDQLESVFTSPELNKEADARPSIPTGKYKATITNVMVKEAGDQSPYPGRRLASLQLAISEGDVRATLWTDVSWEPYRMDPDTRNTYAPDDPAYSSEYPLDKLYKRWVQLEKIVADGQQKSVGQILKEAVGLTVQVSVLEAFSKEDEDMVFPTVKPNQFGNRQLYEEAYNGWRKEMMKAGYLGKNFVQTLSKVTT